LIVHPTEYLKITTKLELNKFDEETFYQEEIHAGKLKSLPHEAFSPPTDPLPEDNRVL
jgi:hypothetical protein